MDRSGAQAIRQPRDRLKGQPQERQHSAAKGGTRDRLPPASGTLYFARGMVTLKGPRRTFRAFAESAGSVRGKPIEPVRQGRRAEYHI